MKNITLLILFILVSYTFESFAQDYSYSYQPRTSYYSNSKFEFGVKAYAFAVTSKYYNGQKQSASNNSQVKEYENDRQGQGLGVHAMWTISGQGYRYLQMGVDFAHLKINDEKMTQTVGLNPSVETKIKTYLIPVTFKLKYRSPYSYIDIGIGASFLTNSISNWISTETSRPSYGGARFTAGAEIGRRFGTNIGLDIGARYYFVEGDNAEERFQLVSGFVGLFIKL